MRGGWRHRRGPEPVLESSVNHLLEQGLDVADTHLRRLRLAEIEKLGVVLYHVGLVVLEEHLNVADRELAVAVDILVEAVPVEVTRNAVADDCRRGVFDAEDPRRAAGLEADDQQRVVDGAIRCRYERQSFGAEITGGVGGLVALIDVVLRDRKSVV